MLQLLNIIRTILSCLTRAHTTIESNACNIVCDKLGRLLLAGHTPDASKSVINWNTRSLKHVEHVSWVGFNKQLQL